MGKTMIALACLLLLAASFAPVSAQSEGYHLIVNTSNSVTSLERKFVEDAFLKKVTRWPNGRPLQPVDGKPKSQVRRFFSESVMKKPAAAIRNYWQVQVFGGRDIPPPELADDADIVAFVSRRPGAIGYVSIYTEIDGAKVKIVSVK